MTQHDTCLDTSTPCLDTTHKSTKFTATTNASERTTRQRKSVAFVDSKHEKRSPAKQRKILECQIVDPSEKKDDAPLDICDTSVNTPNCTNNKNKSSSERYTSDKQEISPGASSKLKLSRGEKRNRLRYTEVRLT